MFRIVVVDSGPLEPPPKVSLDLGHQSSHVSGEVQFLGVFRGDDDSELVFLAATRLIKGLGVHGPVGAVEEALGPVLINPVALDVPEVQRRRFRPTPAQPRDVGLNNNSPGRGAETTDRIA